MGVEIDQVDQIYQGANNDSLCGMKHSLETHNVTHNVRNKQLGDANH